MIADAQATTYNVPNLCGVRTYSITDNSGNALTGNWVTVTGTTTFTITAAPATDSLHSSSPFTLKLHIVLANYTSKTADITFTVNVVQYICDANTVYTPSPAAMLTTYTHIIGDTAYTFTAPTFTTTPYSCNETITYSLTKQDGTGAPSYVTLNASTRVVTISTTNAADAGTVALRVRVTRTQGTSQNLDWSLTLTNPCLAPTAITTAGTTFADVTVGVGLTQTRTFTELTDTKGTQYSVPALCGARTYSILDSSNNVVSWASITYSSPTYTITFAPNIDDLYTTATRTLKLRIVLADRKSVV